VWHSVATTLSVLRSPEVEFAFKMDADSLLMDPTVPLDALLPRGGYHVALSAVVLPPRRPGDLSPRKVTRHVVNSGHLVWRATDWSRAMLEDIWRSYPPPISRACGDQPSYYVALTGHHPSCRASIIGPECNASGDVAYDPRVRVLPNAVLNAWPPSRDTLARICSLGDDVDKVVRAGAGRLADLAAPSSPGTEPFVPSDFELRVPPRTMVLHFSGRAQPARRPRQRQRRRSARGVRRVRRRAEGPVWLGFVTNNTLSCTLRHTIIDYMSQPDT